MKFNPLEYPYASKRQCVYGRNGMVATSHPLAAQTGLRILMQGGNAVDAAVATAAALTVLEPTSNGIGGDAFALFWKDGKIHGLNGSGPAPAGVNAKELRARGYSKMPEHGPLPVTVPGIPATWATLIREHGKLKLAEVLEPARHYAEEGVPVAVTVSENWARAHHNYAKRQDPMYDAWFETFGQTPPHAGQVVQLPDHAATLRRIGRDPEDFYKGTLAEKIADCVQDHGGFLSREDLAAFSPEWVTPIEISVHGVRVLEIPPNGHGIVALMALGILQHLEPADLVTDVHNQIEAIKLSFADALAYVAEPRAMTQNAESLLSTPYAISQANRVTGRAVVQEPGDPVKGGTVYLCTADREGNMVSYIQSNYMGFGSGLVVPGTGIALHNRGANFSLEEGHPNEIAPGKRPYHTIIPGFLMQEDVPLGPFGIMGAFMQPQAHVQVVTAVARDGLNPQAALDKPRFQWVGENRVLVEPDFPKEIAHGLKALGHEIAVSDDIGSFGRGQIILRSEGRSFIGATEKRCDGQVVAY